MKHIILSLCAVLVVVNGWGEEWMFASGLSVSNCNALASEVQLKLVDGERAECRNVSVPRSTFPSINRIAEARATFARTRRAEERHRKKLDAFEDFQ